MKKLYFDLYDLPPTIYVHLKDELKDKLLSSMRSKFSLSFIDAKLASKFPRYRKRAIYDFFYHLIPIWVLREIEELTSFSHEEILNGIEYYGRKTRIYPEIEGKRKLPIPHDLYFDHLSGLISCGSKTLSRITLREEPGRRAYSIAKNLFGDFKCHERYGGPERKQVQIVLPKMLGDIFDYCHPFPSIDEPKENIVAFLSGVLSYKSTIGFPWISINKKDISFLERLKNLSDLLNCSGNIYKKTAQYELKFNKESSLRLDKLIEELPEDLQLFQYQKELIEKRLKRPKAKRSTSEDRKKQILEVLKKEPKTIDQLSTAIGLSYSRTYDCVNKLQDESTIKPVGKIKVKKIYATVFGLCQN